MSDYDDFVKKYGKGAAPSSAATPAPTGGKDYAAFAAKYGKPGGQTARMAAASTPRFQMPNVGDALSSVGDAAKHAGSTAVDLLSRPGRGTEAAIARGPQAGLSTFMHGEPASQTEADRDVIKNRIGVKGVIDKLPAGLVRGTADTAIDMALDPTTYLGGAGLIEKGVNALGRAGFVGAAKGVNALGKSGEGLGAAMDFVSPGGSKIGALKRNLAATEGTKGLDKYSLIRAATKGATNAGTSTTDAVRDALHSEGLIPTKAPLPPKPPPPTVPKAAITNAVKAATAATRTQAKNAAPLGVGPGFFGKPSVGGITQGLERQRAGQKLVANTLGVGEGFFPKKAVVQAPPPVGDLPPHIAAALKRSPDLISKFGQTPVGKLSRAATRGTTSAMFAVPQLPGLPGHGSNIAQLGLLSDPGTALAATGRFFGSGEALPFSGMRTAAQKLPGVSGLKTAQDAALARAGKTGATTVHPEDFGQPGWLDKIPVVSHMARESNRSLQGYDNAVKAALNDKWTKTYLKQGYSPAMAAAKASERVGQDIVDYSDKSDMNRLLQHALPFATFAQKKPGVIARAVARHPERAIAMTRNIPQFQPDADQAFEDPIQGRPLTSIFNALNNKSPQAKGGAPFPGAQYLRASAGAPLDDLLGAIGNAYFTYGPPAKHAEGDAAMGWLKLLLSQTAGNVPGGQPVLNKLGMNYFENQ